MKALVLSGGGARGAYQAGVITAIADVAAQLKIKAPFQIYTGISAGSINASFMATGADDFAITAHRLAKLWTGISSDQVYRTDLASLSKIGLKWMGELSFGGLTGSASGRSLLDTQPLAELLRNNLDLASIKRNIESGALHALAVTALEYRNNIAITFVEAHQKAQEWHRVRRRSERTSISTDHIMASSAIPLIFPAIQANGRFFGDGCVRNSAPLSPALHLGAEHLFVIGVRHRDVDHVAPSELEKKPPSVARVANVILNSILLDGIENDVERLDRVNEFLRRIPDEHQSSLNFKKVNYIWVHPSKDIDDIAAKLSNKMPRVIRYLLKGLGPLDEASEIISYLLFEPEFSEQLLALGYDDGMNIRDKIEAFLLA